MTVSQLLLIVYMIGMAAGLPVDQRGSDDANETDTSPLFPSEAESPRTTTKPQQYILDLYESVYENGIPTDEATDVWAFVDKGELAIPSIKYCARISISTIACTAFSQILPEKASERNHLSIDISNA